MAFMSKKLNKAQRSYTVTEQECLAAMLSIKKFRAYIEGHEFTIITDHASLKWLMSQTDLSTRLSRWALKLQGYKFHIRHRKGSMNIVPDALSRTNTGDLSAFASAILPESAKGIFVDLESEHFSSKKHLELLEKVKNNIVKMPDLKIVNGFLYRRSEHATDVKLNDEHVWKLWIPKSMIPEVLKGAHDDPLSSHNGINKTLDRIRRYYFWPNLAADVKEYVNSCEICKSAKHPNRALRPPMGLPSESKRFLQKIYVDFLGPYPRSKSGNIGIFIARSSLSLNL